MENTHQYPECFPENIDELIRSDGAEENIYTYYRISRTGLVNRDAFLGSYEESLKCNQFVHNRDMFLASQEQLDIGDYSTSGYEKIRDAKSRLKCMKKYEEGPVILVGETNPTCGLSMRTKESKTRHCRNSHIDWWIYKDACPEVFFEKLGDDAL